jgi:hypothetical protein
METFTKHEVKVCPRCLSTFECKAGDIAHCQCYAINLPLDVQDFVTNKYDDCVCKDCLLQLSEAAHFNEELHNKIPGKEVPDL